MRPAVLDAQAAGPTDDMRLPAAKTVNHCVMCKPGKHIQYIPGKHIQYIPGKHIQYIPGKHIQYIPGKHTQYIPDKLYM